MKTAEILHKKIDDLPESAQWALLEYVEFLLHKHETEELDSEKEKLTRELLLKRYEAYQQNREQLSKPMSSWDAKIREKYGWNE